MAPARTQEGPIAGLPHVPSIRTLPELHCELRSAGHEYALAALNAFVAPKARYAANTAFVERSLDQAQRAFPEHNEAFRRLRSAYGIRSHLPVPGRVSTTGPSTSASAAASASTSTSAPSTARTARRPNRTQAGQNRAQQRLRELAEQRAATDDLHLRLRGSLHADAVTALDNFLVDAISDWNAEFAASSVDDAERVFPEHTEAFAYIRSEWHLPPLASGSGSMPVTPTGSAMPRSPFLGPSSRSLSPTSPHLGSHMKLPVPTAPEFGYSVDRPPDYAKEDPDPSSTRLLEQRLAAEADVIPPYGLGLSFVVPAPMYGSSFYARAHESARPLSDVIMSAAPEMSRVSSGFDVATNSDDHYNVNDSYNDNDDVDIDENGNDAWNAEMAAIGAQGVGVPLARQRSGSNAPTYTFTAAQLAGIGIGDSAGAPLVRERSNGPTTYTFTAERLAGVGLDDSVGGVPLTRERSGSNAPTYTFTAEQLAGVRDSHPHASGLSQSQLRERRRSRTDALSRRPPLAPLRTGYGDNPAAAASFIRPSPTVTVSEYTPRTYTFTADDLARVGDRARGGWTSSLGSGSGSGSYWKSFIPRRSSAPSAEQGHKLFRSLSRGERS